MNDSDWIDKPIKNPKKKERYLNTRLQGLRHEGALYSDLMDQQINKLLRKGIIYPPDNPRYNQNGADNWSVDFNMSPYFFFCRGADHQSVEVIKGRRFADKLFAINNLIDQMMSKYVFEDRPRRKC